MISICVSQLSNGTKVVVNQLHPAFRGKEYIVEGTIKEVMNIDDPWMDPKSLSNMAVTNYLMSDSPKAPYNGNVYYGKINGCGYCIHESFLS